MKGICLNLYVPEFERHASGAVLHQWLVDQAKALGIQGGTVTRAISGFGRRGNISVDNVFGESPMEMVFLTSEKLANQLLDMLLAEKLTLFYSKTQAEYGWLGELPQPK